MAAKVLGKQLETAAALGCDAILVIPGTVLAPFGDKQPLVQCCPDTDLIEFAFERQEKGVFGTDNGGAADKMFEDVKKPSERL